MTTLTEQIQSKSPALQRMDQSFPPRFWGRVPKTILMLMTVQPDRMPGMPLDVEDRGIIALYDQEYPAWTNSYGAVSAIMADGRMLGVKPEEFVVTEFFPIKEI